MSASRACSLVLPRTVSPCPKNGMIVPFCFGDRPPHPVPVRRAAIAQVAGTEPSAVGIDSVQYQVQGARPCAL